MKKTKKKGKKKMKKLWKILVPVLALAVIFTCVLAFASSAADTTVTIPDGTVEEGSGTNVVAIIRGGAEVGRYGSVKDAVSAAQSGDTIKFLNDFIVLNGFMFPANKPLTVDFDGHTLYADSRVNFYSNTFMGRGAVDITFTSLNGRGKVVYATGATAHFLTLDDNNAEKKATVTNIDFTMRTSGNVFNAMRGGTLTVSDVTIDKVDGGFTVSLDYPKDDGSNSVLDFDNVDITSTAGNIFNINQSYGSVTGTFTNVTVSAGARVLNVGKNETACATSFTFTDCNLASSSDDVFYLKGGKLTVTGTKTRIAVTDATKAFINDNETKTSDVTLGYGIRFSKNTGLSNGCAALTAIEPTLVKDGLLPDTFPYVYTTNVEVKFNYPDGTSSTVPTAIGSAPVATSALDFNAVAVAKAFTAKKMDFAGWATTEGATEALATLPAVTEEQVGTTVNYYPVLKSIDPSVDYIVISGENGKYGTAATWGDMIKGTDITITLLRDIEITTAVDLTGSKVKLDLNGKSLTSTTSASGTTFMFMLRGNNSSLAVWSSVPGATLSLGKSNPLVQANWAVGDFVIGASSVAEVNGENPYSGNMSINAVSSVVTFNNARGNLCLDGVTVKTDNILFDVGLKRTDGGATVIVKNSDITSGNCVWQHGGAAGQPVEARFINSTVSAKTAFFTTTTAAHKLNIEFNNCYLSGKISDKNGAYSNSTTVEGTLKLTGDTYVNGTVAPEATFEDGKALRPVVKTVKGVTYTKKVAGANEIIGVKFNLTLYSNFNLNFYVLSEYGLGGDTVEIDGHTYTKHEYSYAAHEIAEAQNIKLGSYDAISVSVLDYAKALFALDDSALMSNEKTLMADALVYANAAAKFIDKAENAEITALLTANETYKSSLKTFNGTPKDMTSVSGGFVSASLDLKSQPRFIFTIKSGASVSVSYKNFWNVTVTKTEADAVDGKIIIDDMRIFDFANEFTLTVGEKRTTYSLADYAANTDVQELCNALYTYIETAKAFKTANNPKV